MGIKYQFENPTSWTHTTVTVGLTSTLIVELDLTVKYILIQSKASEIVYVTFGVPATTSGIMLAPMVSPMPGGFLEMGETYRNIFRGNIYAICESGSMNLNITRGF